MAVLGMVWAFTGGANLFMYQSAPLVLGYSYGYFTAKDLFKLAFILIILEGFLLATVMSFYWPLIGLSWIK
jgi:di/tricarboxylate transporter